MSDHSDTPDGGSVDEPLASAETDADEPTSTRPSIRKIATRALVIIGSLALAVFVLASAFDDLDLDAVVDALRSLQDAEILSLLSMWVLWVAAQGLLTASLVPGMPVRQGVIAYLGPAAITSAVPGPSDLPIRHRMFTSWGYSPGEATLAVAAGGIFSIGIKLLLPVIAAIGLLISDAPISDTMQTVVAIVSIVGLGLGVFAFVFGSERRTERVGRMIAPIWAFVLRMLRKPEPPDLATVMVEARQSSLATLHDKWLVASWGTVLTAATKFALLLMALRFTGIGEGQIGWPEVFVVFALVQGLTVIPITPGDAGVSDVAYIGMLTAAAGSQYVNQITAAVLLFRVLTWLLIIPIGLIVLAFWQRTVAASHDGDGDDDDAETVDGDGPGADASE